MKTFFLAGSLVLTCNAVFAQARETTITYGKEKVNAVKVEVNAPAKEVQEALLNKLTATGVKARKGTANSVTYNDVVIPELTSDTVDVWTRVQKNGNNSIIYMGVKNQQGNYISSDADAASVEKIKGFLYDFVRTQNFASNDAEIASLMDSVKADKTSFEAYSTEKTRIESQMKDLTRQKEALEQKYNAGKTQLERREQRLESLKVSTEGNAQTDKAKKPGKNKDKKEK